MHGKSQRFAAIALPHLDAAYNLARWLTRNDADAADVVQEACLRALTYFDGYRGENGRSWLLTIVRNTCYDWLERNRPSAIVPLPPDIESHAPADGSEGDAVPTPESLAIGRRDAALLGELMAELPLPLREMLVLREIEELSYRGIGEVVGVPIGTVMSRLARARGALKEAWRRRTARERNNGS